MTPTSLQLHLTEHGAQLALLFMLASVMPDSDAGKALLMLTLFGCFKLEFGRFKLDYCGWIQARR